MVNEKPGTKPKEIFSTELFAPFFKVPQAVFDSLGKVAESIEETFAFDEINVERSESSIEGSRDDGIYFWLSHEGMGIGFDGFLEDTDAYYYLLEMGNILNEFSRRIYFSGLELEITGRDILEVPSIEFFRNLLSGTAQSVFMKEEKTAQLFTLSNTFFIKEGSLTAIVKAERGTDPTITGSKGFWMTSHQVLEKIIAGQENETIEAVENCIYFRYSIVVKPEEPLRDLNKSVFFAYMVYHTVEKEFSEF